MTISDMTNPGSMTGANVTGSDGEKLGKVDAIYYDNDTDQPAWAAVKSGLFGSHVSLVPLQAGNWDGDTLSVPFDKEALKTAPHHDPDVEISHTDEEELYRHYGLSSGGTGTTQQSGEYRTEDEHRSTGVAGTGVGTTDVDDRRDRTGEHGQQGHDTSGPNTDDAMTRSEEQLRVGTETREAGRARLRKHVVTENVSTTVPVSHEEVTIQREPITEANRGDAHSGGDLTEEEHEVTLSEERAVVDKDVTPVERVRLGTETVTGQQQVDETVRKERIDTDGVDTDLDTDRRRSE